MGATASLAVSSPLDFSAVDDDAAAEAMLQVKMLLKEQGPLKDLGRLVRGRLDEARPLFEEFMAGSRAALGDAHPATLTSINNLGMLLQDQGRLDEAQPLLEEVVAGCRAALGDAHPSTLNASGNLGMLLADAGALDEALSAVAVERCEERTRNWLVDE